MDLEVFPEDLPIISAQLNANHASLNTMMAAGASTCVPLVPSGADAVNAWIQFELAKCGVRFIGHTTPGLGHMLAGSEILLPVSANYRAADIAGGIEVNTQGAALAG